MAAICGTNVHIYNWDEWAQKTIPVPMHVGHEFVGTVAEIGSNICDFKPGDLVSGEGHLACGREMHETWYKMTVLIQSGLDITPVITHSFHYTEYEKAFEAMRSDRSGKVTLNWVDE